LRRDKKLDCEDNGEDIAREYKRKEKPASTHHSQSTTRH